MVENKVSTPDTNYLNRLEASHAALLAADQALVDLIDRKPIILLVPDDWHTVYAARAAIEQAKGRYIVNICDECHRTDGEGEHFDDCSWAGGDAPFDLTDAPMLLTPAAHLQPGVASYEAAPGTIDHDHEPEAGSTDGEDAAWAQVAR